VQDGPARTVLQSATRSPARGPAAGGAVIAAMVRLGRGTGRRRAPTD
jgi:hypothetical protein